MKQYLLLLFGLLSFALAEARPFTITMQGGGRHQRFDYVTCTRYALTCRGAGSLVCPVVWEVALEKGVKYQISEVVDYVSKQIEGGERTGKVMYADAFPLKWDSGDDGFEIEIDVDEVIEVPHE